MKKKKKENREPKTTHSEPQAFGRTAGETQVRVKGSNQMIHDHGKLGSCGLRRYFIFDIIRKTREFRIRVSTLQGFFRNYFSFLSVFSIRKKTNCSTFFFAVNCFTL